MTDVDAKAGRMLKLMAGSSWFNFVCEMRTLIEESAKDDVFDWAMEACPSLKEDVPRLYQMLERMGEELSEELSQYIVNMVEGEE